jgi:hypothetical protein
MEKTQNQVEQTTEVKSVNARRLGTAAAVSVAMLAPLASHAEPIDVAAGATVIAGGVAVIAAIGAAKMIPAATMAVWGYVKQAFNRT